MTAVGEKVIIYDVFMDKITTLLFVFAGICYL